LAPGAGEINHAFPLSLIDRLGRLRIPALSTTEAGLAWMAPCRDRGGKGEDSAF
jgi:hypothetical protein